MKDQFVVPARLRTTSFVLMAIGLLTLVIGAVAVDKTLFWAGLLQNSVFFLLIVLASTFFIAATTLAQGGWQMTFRRVMEAISMTVIPLGVVVLVVVYALMFGKVSSVYPWADRAAVASDKVLNAKGAFLSYGFVGIATIIVIGLWMFFTWKFRQMSIQEDGWDLRPDTGRKILWRGTVWTGSFMVIYVLSVGSTTPWMWLMSIDAHWYSTMYSWYTFISSFVSGIAVIILFTVYLKKQGYLPFVNIEHLHDLGKFLFAFSIFWTYLWFSQYMLIWYANIPDETVYFVPRVRGEWRGIFFFNLIINFIAPFLILMKRDAKRNYTTLVFMSIVVIFGHWIDFWQMVMPGSYKHLHFPLFELGIAVGFIGFVIFWVANQLTKASLTVKNHPYLKESILHHT
ncbi:quinol:cytochrome C oxidoreductase [Chitinophaga parva]|uniref:Quinol:cytochrome C oxidoreductase n=1 Tax=Chitinophaga parva TaxID=2169414 RepID=A0A2T7BM53_9BACT|nr:quinol:cytochrome C oxidoreductase [Chitinophaga parva]PUZ28752.1 quinol:cytochrome C oxidoreductase [Chitinophaga parva]